MREGWIQDTLGQLFETVTGSTPPKSNKAFYGGDLPFVKPPELMDGELNSANDSLTDVGASEARVLPVKSVLVSCIGNLGKIGFNTVPVAFNQQINAIKPDTSKALPEFVFYQMLSPSFVDQLQSLASGTTVPIVNKSKFNSINIVLPPLPEQKRIVALLDKAFAGIDRAIANTEKNLKNARELFESTLQSVFTEKGEGWVSETMDTACSLITCGVAATPKYVDESVGVPFLSAQNVKNGKVTLHKFRYITQELHEHLTKKNKPKKGDLLYSRVGAGFGESAVVEYDFEFSVYVSLTLIKPKTDKLDSYFLKYCLNSPEIKFLAKKSISSSGVPNLNVKTVRGFHISYPDLKTQRELVAKINSQELKTLELQKKYEKKLEALAELKQSILQKAFTGELTADNEVREEAVA